MKNELIIKRTHLSYGNREAEYLAALSAYPLQNGKIFARIFHGFTDLEAFLKDLEDNLGLLSSFSVSLLEQFNDEFFSQHDLVLMFSDERSGSNRLQLEKLETEEQTVHITITRSRGLTMDMAYLFIFLILDSKEYVQAQSEIVNI